MTLIPDFNLSFVISPWKYFPPLLAISFISDFTPLPTVVRCQGSTWHVKEDGSLFLAKYKKSHSIAPRSGVTLKIFINSVAFLAQYIFFCSYALEKGTFFHIPSGNCQRVIRSLNYLNISHSHFS